MSFYVLCRPSAWGTWIETGQKGIWEANLSVAPHAGAWIETNTLMSL